MFPGLTGGSDQGYVKAVARTMMSDGFDVAVFHHRGVCRTPYTALGFASLSSTEEVDVAMDFIKKEAGPDTDFVAIGLSMGANIMVRYVGMQGASTPFSAIASVNNPFDLWLTINLMRGSVSEAWLVKKLRNDLILRKAISMDEEE